MIRLEKTEVFNFEGALRGMRNPMNSWNKSDSDYCGWACDDCYIVDKVEQRCYNIGENDLNLCKRLIKGGTEHRKFLRQIMVCVDITAPLYFWKEFDTYKVGTTANSTSTMHKIHSKPFDLEDFSHDKLHGISLNALLRMVDDLEAFRKLYLETKDKEIWYQIIQLLPSSYHQTRTVTMTYENLLAMHHQRRHHKLDEWHTFCDWVEKLPYMKEFLSCIE